MLRLSLLLAIALTGCKPSEAEVLEKNYRERVQKYGAPRNCAEEQKIASAWAREGEQKKFDEAKLSADMECLHQDVDVMISRPKH